MHMKHVCHECEKEKVMNAIHEAGFREQRANQCKERVIRDYEIHQCPRKSGYGRNGEYCKQHAKSYPDKNQETITMYAARFVYDCDLAKCEVFNQTEKTLVVFKAVSVVGSAKPWGFINIPNSEWCFFLTAKEALEYLWSKVRRKLDNLQKEMNGVRYDLEWISNLLNIEDIDEKIAKITQERTEELKKEMDE